MYGRRVGHALRPHHKALMRELLPRVALPDYGAIDLATLFPGAQGYALEIGFGGGEHLAAQAQAHPDWGFIGVEPFINGVAKGLAHIEAAGLTNVRLSMGDGREILERLPDRSLDAVYILHPDPWPKARHFKRRVVQTATLDQIVRVLKPSGEFRLATDVPDYAEWTLAHATARDDLCFVAQEPRDWLERSADWPETRYGQKAKAAGRGIVYLRFRPAGVD
jgi:tRNA (guanine-N7-)-methyltransferase